VTVSKSEFIKHARKTPYFSAGGCQTNEIVSLERRLLENLHEITRLDLLPHEVLKESHCGHTECFPHGSFDVKKKN